MSTNAAPEDLYDALDYLVGVGVLESVPTCIIRIPSSMASRISGVEWRPWDGDPRSLKFYRTTPAGLLALKEQP